MALDSGRDLSISVNRFLEHARSRLGTSIWQRRDEAPDLADQTVGGSLDRITRLVTVAVDAPVAAFSVPDRDRQVYLASCGVHLLPNERPTSFCHHAMLQDDVFVVEDAARDARFERAPLVRFAPHVRFYAGVPVRAPDGSRVGVLCVMDLRPRRLTEPARMAMRDLAALVETELLLRRAAERDHLTGLFNRRYLEEAIAREWRRAVRESPAPLSVLSIDVDHFKRFNDRFGHPAGDAALRTVADVLQQNLKRPGDLVGRFGGEEFLACLPLTDAAGAAAAAETLRAELEALQLPHPDSPSGVVTISVGVATAADAARALFAPSDLLVAADEALYRAKDEGRNRVVSADTTGPGRGISRWH